MPYKKASVWQVGVIFSRINPDITTFKDADWLDHRIRVSIRPNERWQDAYIRQFHEPPEARFQCFFVEGM